LEALVDAGLDVTRGRPLDGDGVLLRCLPWLTAGLLACTFLPLLSEWPSTGDLIALALVPMIVGTALFLRAPPDLGAGDPAAAPVRDGGARPQLA
jgi:hypothetical protein